MEGHNQWPEVFFTPSGTPGWSLITNHSMPVRLHHGGKGMRLIWSCVWMFTIVDASLPQVLQLPSSHSPAVFTVTFTWGIEAKTKNSDGWRCDESAVRTSNSSEWQNNNQDGSDTPSILDGALSCCSRWRLAWLKSADAPREKPRLNKDWSPA